MLESGHKYRAEKLGKEVCTRALGMISELEQSKIVFALFLPVLKKRSISEYYTVK